MRARFWSLGLLLVIAVAQADDLSKKYTKGAGSKFTLSLDLISSDVSIYVTHSTPNDVGIETYFSANGLPVELWQQTQIVQKGNSVDIAAAYIYSKDLGNAERIPLDKLASKNGFELRDFVMLDKKAMEKFKIADESVQTPAGKVQATHYRKKNGADTLDFWVSDEAKPIGLVKLTSTGKQSFQMVLTSLLKNVQGKIDPAKAIPLTEKGKKLLGLAEGFRMLP